MEIVVSKSKFKAQALKYFRMIEETGGELIVTDHAKPVIRIIPYRRKKKSLLNELRNSVLSYDRPMDPVGENDWELLK